MEQIDETQNKKRPIFKFWDRERDPKILKFIAILIIINASLIIIKNEAIWQFGDSLTDENFSSDDINPEESDCNALGVNLHGFLSGYISNDTKNENGENAEDQASSEDIVFTIQEADKDDTIKAIILEVDSSGGFPVSGEEVADALKRAKKPTVAWIRGQGLSAAYWAATGANTIFASAVSDVGSIGVTLSYLDNYKKNLKDGLTFNSLSTGKFKDTGSPDKPLTNEEKTLIMRDLNIVNEHFIKSVAVNRNLDIAKVRKLADGSSMPGELALQNGLIDKIGGIYEIEDYLKEEIGEEVRICW